VQDAVRRRPQQQGEPVPPVASNDDGVDVRGYRDAVDFRFRPAEYQVTVVFRHVGIVAELIQARLRLILDQFSHDTNVTKHLRHLRFRRPEPQIYPISVAPLTALTVA